MARPEPLAFGFLSFLPAPQDKIIVRLATFSYGAKTAYGVVRDDGIVNLTERIGMRYPDLKSLIASGMHEIAPAIDNARPDHKLSDVVLLPPIPNPDKILCAGLNYHAHLEETGKAETANPTIFLRVANSQQGHDQPLLVPAESHKFDYEGEVAVVIGKRGRRISEADAWGHIAGYSCYNDASVRDWQVHTSQWGPGKNFFKTGGFGPWIVTTDEIGPDAELSLVTRLNGQEVQRTNTSLLIFSIPRLISYLSIVMPLEPGDVIVSGTPGGVGAKRTPQLWMKEGDTVEVEVDRVGVLRNSIARED
jgi:2-keto-4-pentenoate hydratase/2-oxohepta-3-ene-1,7-dioic acid hydratase in catechol pathway